MDFNKIKSKETFFVHLSHPTEGLLFDGKKEVGIHVLSADSSKYRQKVSQMFDRASKRKSSKQKTIDEIDQENIELNAAACSSSDCIEFNGKPVATTDQFAELFASPDHKWIFEQVRAAIGERANFF